MRLWRSAWGAYTLDCVWELKLITKSQVFGQGINYFHIENLLPFHVAIRSCLKLTGLYGRGLRNAAQIELRRHDVISSRIPKAFDGFKILHLSDLHVEMSEKPP